MGGVADAHLAPRPDLLLRNRPHRTLSSSPVPDLDTNPSNDPALLARARQGDQEAFGTLMRAHYEPVFRTVCSVLRNEHDARDVAQEVWLTVWRELPNFRGEAKFSTWLHPIAVRKSLDHLRKRRRWFDRFLPFASAVGEDSTAPAAADPVVENTARDDAETAERHACVHRALEALPPKHRAVLALRELQGLSYDEIAAAMKLPVGTVMSRLYHARRLLAQKLKDSP
ncbi:MAG: RNA polymerase subunit sigma [Opitutus sp.]|nr:RNA polymerase subunit sigma [Opitutus sp.]